MRKDYQIRIEGGVEVETVENFNDIDEAMGRYEALLADTPPNSGKTFFELIEVLRQDCRKG